MSIQNHYNWELLLKCGGCFFWSGFSNGGAPSFVDTHSAWLHPLSMLATFLFGAFNGGKVLLVASLVLAGLAQWWCAKVLSLGTLPRIWGALLAVAGGHLVGRMEVGSVPLALSTASCSLVIPAALNLALHGGRKNAIILGLLAGLAVLSGQGYLQIALLFSLPLLMAYLMVESGQEKLKLKPYWRELLPAALLAFLIAAPLLIPLAHNTTMLDKVTDPQFGAAQPLRYALLNLVVDDDSFFLSEILHRPALPYLYINYIGWLPLGLAVYALFKSPPESRKITTSLLLAIAAVYFVSDIIVLKFFGSLSFGRFVTGIRNPPLIQGLAVPYILTLSSLGLQSILRTESHIVHFISSQAGMPEKSARIHLKWPIAILIVLFSTLSVVSFAQKWIRSYSPPVNPYPTIELLKTEYAQWVQTPFGDYSFIPAALENNLKVRALFRPWNIKGPDLPLPYLEAVNISDGSKAPEYEIKPLPENQYAYIATDEGNVPCQAKARGGNIEVTCESASAGTLTVYERALSGWSALRDGEKVSLIYGSWLSVPAPEGKHVYAFQYRPWDAPLGLFLSICGWLLGILLLARSARPQAVGDIH